MLPPKYQVTMGVDQLAKAANSISSPDLNAEAREALHAKLYFSALAARFQAQGLSAEDEDFLATICHLDRNLGLFNKWRNHVG